MEAEHPCQKSLAHVQGVQEAAGTRGCTGLARAKTLYLHPWLFDCMHRDGGYSVGFALQMVHRVVLEVP